MDRYYFYKEIPMFAKYEMEVHVVSWDDKWVSPLPPSPLPLPLTLNPTLRCTTSASSRLHPRRARKSAS
jgi:hypothetical protein